MAEAGSSRPRSAVRPITTQRSNTPPLILSSTPPSSVPKIIPPGPISQPGPQSPPSVPSPACKCKPVSQGPGRQRATSSDIGKLVEAYRNIVILSWPLSLTYEFFLAVLSWEYPIITMGTWLSLQCLCLYMTVGQFLGFSFLFLLTIASLGYLSYTSQQLTKMTVTSSDKQRQIADLLSLSSPSPPASASSSMSSSLAMQGAASQQGAGQRNIGQSSGPVERSKVTLSSSPPKRQSLLSLTPSTSSTTANGMVGHGGRNGVLEAEEQERRRELLVEYRQMMRDLSRWLALTSTLLRALEDVLLWRRRWRTAIFYLTLFIGLTCIIYLPFRWVSMATANCLFVAHPRCYAGVLKFEKWIVSMSPWQQGVENADHLENTQQKGPSESNLQKDGIVSSHPLAEDINSNEAQEERVTGNRGVAGGAPTRPGGGDQAPQAKNMNTTPKKFESGMCYLCGTLFTSVLKRRRYCRYCGRDFCPKCCSRKLPRSALGATAPAAQTEKELVCNLCVIKLTGEEVAGIR